jgi:excisionase family DNA binding protein
MQQLISPREAAERIGVSVATVKGWVHRAQHPLPSVTVGKSGRFVKVIASEIDAWLVAEASRKTGSVRERA